MSTSVTITGTGCPIPDGDRAGPGVLVHYVRDYHADTPLIGKQAAELGVPKLILTHLIPAPKTDADRQLFIDEVRSGGYDGEIVVADDLYTAEL